MIMLAAMFAKLTLYLLEVLPLRQLDCSLRLFDLPPELGSAPSSPSHGPVLDDWEASVCIREGETIYDYAWYPYMSSEDPATCVLACTSRVRCPCLGHALGQAVTYFSVSPVNVNNVLMLGCPGLAHVSSMPLLLLSCMGKPVLIWGANKLSIRVHPMQQGSGQC